MINFTVGPVQSSDEIRKIGGMQVPYFRTKEFSEIMLENERLMLEYTNAPEGARVVFLTGSGTAAMEASIINCLNENDKALVVNGGSFGSRFASMLELHGIPHDEIKIERGKQITEADLLPYSNKGYTAFLVNLHETSTGVLYNLDLISKFCRDNDLFLIVDAISAFLADEFDMDECGAGVMITGSQKALACAPGISILVLRLDAIERIQRIKCKCMYLDLNDALKNGERGQTPFTPAVGVLLQINKRLNEIKLNGGVKNEQEKISENAKYFRDKIKNMPVEIASESMSNAVTPIHPVGMSAYDIFLKLKDEYNIWVCPNGGDLKDEIFRVGHIGSISKEDIDKLISALTQVFNQ